MRILVAASTFAVFLAGPYDVLGACTGQAASGLCPSFFVDHECLLHQGCIWRHGCRSIDCADLGKISCEAIECTWNDPDEDEQAAAMIESTDSDDPSVGPSPPTPAPTIEDLNYPQLEANNLRHDSNDSVDHGGLFSKFVASIVGLGAVLAALIIALSIFKQRHHQKSGGGRKRQAKQTQQQTKTKKPNVSDTVSKNSQGKTSCGTVVSKC